MGDKHDAGAAPQSPAETITSPPQSPFAFPRLLIFSVIARLPYGMGAVGVLTVGVMRGFGPEKTGLLATCFTVALGLAAPVWGLIADRRGLPVVLGSCVVANLSGTALLLPPAFASSVGGALLLGVGTPPVAAAMRTTWNRLLPEGQPRGRAAVIESILADGIHIIGRVFVAVLAGLGSQIIILVQALLLALGSLTLSQDRRVRPAPAAHLGGSVLASLRRGWPLFLLTLLTCSAHGCIATAFAVVPSGAAVGPVLMTVWGVGSFAGGFAFLKWQGGKPAPLVVPVGLILVAMLCLASILAFGYGVPAQLLAALALGLPLAPTFSGLYTLAADFAPTGAENQTFATMSSIIVVSFGLGTSVTGVASGFTNPLDAGFVSASAFTVAALVSYITVPRLRGRNKAAVPR